jgi:gamma-glutamylcyclotransferase (GGCT)/AIG2-like uncharacterized protein YtfP
MNPDYLFVYGTLRRGSDNDLCHLLGEHADFVSYANYQGQLYEVDYYPGAVPSDNPLDQVRGELYRLKTLELADFVLSVLDEYEECGTAFQAPTEFVRRVQPVWLESGERVIAWVYLYNRVTDKLKRLCSGDFYKQR